MKYQTLVAVDRVIIQEETAKMLLGILSHSPTLLLRQLLCEAVSVSLL